MSVIERSDIQEKLRQWVAGELSALELHGWAVDLLSSDELDFVDGEGEGRFSVAREALAELEMLDMNLVIEVDVPIFTQFLAAPEGGFESAYVEFLGQLQQIDHEARKLVLKDTEPYRRFCVSA